MLLSRVHGAIRPADRPRGEGVSFPGWEKSTIRLESGEYAEGLAPVIVSASRRTDIPAFHAEWFVRRLRSGYVKWVNPFSRVPQYVSFEHVRAIVFWTKNPRPILSHLEALDRRGIGYYFHFTLNDYESEGLEPAVPPLAQRIETFRELSRRVGKEKVVWRYDPILATDDLNVERFAERIAGVGNALHAYTEKLVFAFADIERYASVQRRLRRRGGGCRELTIDEMRAHAEHLAAMARGWGLTAASCAEAIDLAAVGIRKNKCIDDELLLRLFPQDKELARFLGPAESRYRLKDKGQRRECGCIVSKDIGAYDTCPHFCRYCYANTSEGAVRAAMLRHEAHAAGLK